MKFTGTKASRTAKVLPPERLIKGLNVPDSGSLLVGDKGMLFSPNDYGAAYVLLPEENFKGYQNPRRRCRATARATTA